MGEIFQRIRDFFSDRTLGAKRSKGWRAVRNRHMEAHPRCAISGKATFLHVHHIKPFWLSPDSELEPSNLVTLTRWHHFYFGHLGSWKSYNKDILLWIEKVKQRP